MSKPLAWTCVHMLDLKRIRAYLNPGACDKLVKMVYNLSDLEFQAEEELKDIINLAKKEGQESEAWKEADCMDVDELVDELQEALNAGQGITMYDTMRIELLLDLLLAVRDKIDLSDFISNAQKWRELLMGETLSN